MPLIFILVVDWIIKTFTSEGNHRIKWTALMQLDDLNFADDLTLLSYIHKQIQVKKISEAQVSASMGLKTHKGRAKSSNVTRRPPTQSHLMEKL
ncbi:unnamed protein product [Schistosoma margrebowiei]|uniref:Uncharacterized protein n=1 Tax=Schistosoma margrebowiei TaxID=48269 RepID=A0A183N3A0_9TREM|nr:unnamed protein product [Schistosoma margrebowiei]